jgi:hypothetical protein
MPGGMCAITHTLWCDLRAAANCARNQVTCALAASSELAPEQVVYFLDSKMSCNTSR